ncbi:MAG: PDDEXK nuclease domain-containing protein [Owenweeksia sp.]|nr:PDDEXK nuclease domain-containing protein [Owenweeksia sp.]
MKFPQLITAISDIHHQLQAEAAKSVNRLLTIRNWLIGFYIVEYEQKGEDRAKYGENILHELEVQLSIKGVSSRNLYLSRLFYLTYPQILQTLSAILRNAGILQTPSAKLLKPLDKYESQGKEVIGKSISEQINETSSAKLPPDLQVPPEKLISRLSFSHFVELMKVDDPLKRTFYEIECIKGSWSVRELKRQINSLYFERSGLSKKPELLSEKLQQTVKPEHPSDIIKNIYAFEFLGLPAKDAIEESDLEQALLDNLQHFLLEMGHGFCLEARQKRILIGDEYFFIDLVFYHRILKCHVLVDLKMEKFQQANAGQLNTYLNFYKDQVMEELDNPPVGILLVTHKNEALVEYATAGMDQHLFVQKYLVELPSKQQLEDFIRKEMQRL